MPLVENGYKQNVDEMIKIELENFKVLSGVKQKKKKKKKAKKKKKKKKKGLKIPGYKLVANKDKKDLLVDLIHNIIVKKLPPRKLTDFIGEFNYIHSMLDDINLPPKEPSMALIR